MIYLDQLPAEMPVGKVLLHNSPGGPAGFRMWLADPDARRPIACACGFASELGSDYIPLWLEIGRFAKEARRALRSMKLNKPRSNNQITGSQRIGQEEVFFYSIGNAGNEKYVTISQLCTAYEQLIVVRWLDRDWFKLNITRSESAPCDYNTIGEILRNLGYAEYQSGVNRKTAAVPELGPPKNFKSSERAKGSGAIPP